VETVKRSYGIISVIDRDSYTLAEQKTSPVKITTNGSPELPAINAGGF
jgi:hypothetical protein